MKAKHILTAIALPAMLAACSQDEDLSGALSQKDYSNVPTVDVDFTASVNDGDAQTRMATQFGWEKNDKIGLAWLGDGTVIGSGGFDGKAYQNHPLFCTDPATTAFKTETMLYVGKYYAYMPYNEDVKTVEEVTFKTTDQELSADRNDYAKKAIYISPKLTELKADPEKGEEGAGMGKNVKLNISRLSNAATVNLTFKNASKYKDLKVTGIAVDAQDGSSSSVLPASFKYIPKKDNDVAEWSALAANDILKATSGAFYNSNSPTEGAITATSKEGLPVVDGKLTTYILTLAATAAPTKMVFTVTTNYGKVEVEWDGKTGDDEAIVVKDNGDADAKAIGAAKIFNVFGASGSMDVAVDMAKLDVPTEVTTQAELDAALNTLVIKGQTEEADITVNPVTKPTNGFMSLKDFTLPEGLKCTVKLVTGSNAENGFVFRGNTVINSPMILGKAWVYGTMTVKNVANEDNEQQTTLTTTTSEKLTIGIGSKLINEGKIENASGATIELKGDVKEGEVSAAFVSNAATATVSGSGIFTNGGDVQWIAGTLPSVAAGNVYANVTTFDQLAGAAAAFDKGTGTATNEVIIDGSLSIGGKFMTLDFTNIKKMTIKGDVTLNMQAAYTVTGLATINVESGSLNFTEGDATKAKEFETEAGCKLNLSKGTELNVAAGVELNLGAGSEIKFEGATVNNNGVVKAGSLAGAGTWIGNGYTPVTGA